MSDKRAMHFTEMLHLLSEAHKTGLQVNLRAWTADGGINDYSGWLVHSDYWRGGYIRLRHPISGEIRLVPQIYIFEFNRHTIYL